MAIQNLVWGLAEPFAGVLADRYGSARVPVDGDAPYAGRVAAMAYLTTPFMRHFSAGVFATPFRFPIDERCVPRLAEVG